MRIQSVNSIVKSEIQREFIGKGAWASLLLFVFAANLLAYLAFKYIAIAKIWNGVYWIILLFACLNSSSQIFKESKAQFAYLHQLLDPKELLWGKIIYATLINLVIVTASSLVYLLFFQHYVSNFFLFFTISLLGGMAIAALLTVTASIAFKAAGGNSLLSILSIPVLIPLLIVLLGASNSLLKNTEFSTFLNAEIYANQTFNIKGELLSMDQNTFSLEDEDGKIRKIEMDDPSIKEIKTGETLVLRGQFDGENSKYIVEDWYAYQINQSGIAIKILLIVSIIVLLYSAGLWIFPKYWFLN